MNTEAINCMICLGEIPSELSQWHELDCGGRHQYCVECIERWIVTACKAFCPMCKRDITRCGTNLLDIPRVQQLNNERITAERERAHLREMVRLQQIQEMQRIEQNQLNRELRYVDMLTVMELYNDNFVMDQLTQEERNAFEYIVRNKRGLLERELRICYNLSDACDAYHKGVGYYSSALRRMSSFTSKFKSMLAKKQFGSINGGTTASTPILV